MPNIVRPLYAVFSTLSILALLFTATPVAASLILMFPEATSGTGLGAVNTVLTIQNDPSEEGCVAWDGSMDVTGSTACPPGSGLTGGDETAANETRTLSELGLSSAFNLRVVFNFNEDNNDQITIDDLLLTIYSPAGDLLYTAELAAPVIFEEPFSGTGTSGFVFRLDTEQAAEAQAFFDNPDNRLGLAAQVLESSAGSETFFLADAEDITPPETDLSLTKTDSPEPVAVGSTLTYTLTVENLGPNNATGVVVADTLPASVTFQSASPSQGTCSRDDRVVTCDLGTVNSGATATVTIEVIPNAEGNIINTAAVLAEESDPQPDNNGATEETEVVGGVTPTVDLALTKVDSPDPVAVNGTLTYTLTVENQSLQDASGVTLTDTLPDSFTFASLTTTQGSCNRSGRVVSCDLGVLTAGSTATVTIEGTATAEGNITNSATVSADQPDSDTTDNGATEITQVGVGAAETIDLSLGKTASPDPVAAGSTLTYTLTIENAGPDAATGVTVTDTLPSSVTFVSASPSQGSCSQSGRTVSCDLGSLAAAGSATVTITVTPNHGGVITNTASVSATEQDSAPGNNDALEETQVTTDAEAQADLALSKSASPDPASLGSTLTYTLTVDNLGPDGATGVTVTDTLPSSVTFVSASPSQGSCSQSGRTVSCDLGTIASTGSATVTIEVTPTREGQITNTATVSGNESDPAPGDNDATEITQVGEGPIARSDLALVKQHLSDPAVTGQPLTYLLTASNHGPNQALGVTVSDILPPSVDFTSASPDQGSCSESGGVVTCDLGTLDVGDVVTIEVTVVPRETGTIFNEAFISAEPSEPNPGDNQASEDTLVEALPDVLEIPTLDEIGLAFLALLMAFAALPLLRRA